MCMCYMYMYIDIWPVIAGLSLSYIVIAVIAGLSLSYIVIENTLYLV